MIRPADFFCGGKKRKREKKREIVSAEMLVPRGIFLLIINPVFDLIFTRPTTGKREKKNWTTDKKKHQLDKRGEKNVVRLSVYRRRPKKRIPCRSRRHIGSSWATLAAGQ
jgi:hypothetical protein